MIRDVLFCLGILLVAAGLGAWDWRAAAVVVGVFLVGCALFNLSSRGKL